MSKLLPKQVCFLLFNFFFITLPYAATCKIEVDVERNRTIGNVRVSVLHDTTKRTPLIGFVPFRVDPNSIKSEHIIGTRQLENGYTILTLGFVGQESLAHFSCSIDNVNTMGSGLHFITLSGNRIRLVVPKSLDINMLDNNVVDVISKYDSAGLDLFKDISYVNAVLPPGSRRLWNGDDSNGTNYADKTNIALLGRDGKYELNYMDPGNEDNDITLLVILVSFLGTFATIASFFIGVSRKLSFIAFFIDCLLIIGIFTSAIIFKKHISNQQLLLVVGDFVLIFFIGIHLIFHRNNTGS